MPRASSILSFSIRDGNSDRELTLTSPTNVRCGLDRLPTFFSRQVPPRWIDLIRVAASIYFADRLIRRGSKQKPESSRRILLEVTVSDAGFWNSSDVHGLIQVVTEFLSGDHWELTFRQADVFGKPVHWLLDKGQRQSVTPSVCLYSGGLDSAAGLVELLSTDANEPVVAVTVHHQPHQPRLTQSQFDLVNRTLRFDWRPLLVPVAINWASGLDRSCEENTQRCRSNLFTAVGAIAAACSGASSVDIFESGVGAFNVPPMAGMLGWKSTKGCHPYFLSKMNDLASLVIGREVKFNLRNMQKTKADMVAELARIGCGQIVQHTVSCSSYPLRESGAKQCGVCAACLLRRQSILAAGCTEPLNTYKYDVFGDTRAANAVPESKLQYLKAYLMQAVELVVTKGSDRLPNPVVRHLNATGACMTPGEWDDAKRVLSRYGTEWMDVASACRQRGIRWAELVKIESSA